MSLDYAALGPVVLERIDIAAIADKIAEFGEQNYDTSRFLDETEVRDYTFEFIDLFANVLRLGRVDVQEDAYQALGRLMLEVHDKIRMRGGSLKSLLRLMQFIQSVFTDSLLRAEVEPSIRDRILYIVRLFQKLGLDIFGLLQAEEEELEDGREEEPAPVSAPVPEIIRHEAPQSPLLIHEIWEGVLSFPVPGAFDADQAEDAMEALLTEIEAKNARVVLFDFTHANDVDPDRIQTLLRATALMGAQSIFTGISPQVARLLSTLNLEGIPACRTLSGGLSRALNIMGLTITQAGSAI